MARLRRLLGFLRHNWRYIFTENGFIMSRDWDSHHAHKKERFRNRFYLVASCIEAGNVVADIGCGNGEMLGYLKEKRGISASSLGVDFSREALDSVAGMGFTTKLANVADQDFKLDTTYDYIICSEIIEHLRDAEQFLMNIRDRARHGIIITIPNTGYFPERLRLLFGRFPYIGPHHPAEHVHFWTVRDFNNWAGLLGYEVRKIQGCAGFPWLYRVWPSLFAYNVLYKIRSRPV